MEIAGNQLKTLRFFNPKLCLDFPLSGPVFDEISGCFDILGVSACEEYAYRI
jgi:hypothetical protein